MAKIIGDGAARVGVTDDGMVSLETCDLLTPHEAHSLADELKRAAEGVWRIYIYEPFNMNTRLRVRMPIRLADGIVTVREHG
jgi:hypothetical protein